MFTGYKCVCMCVNINVLFDKIQHKTWHRNTFENHFCICNTKLTVFQLLIFPLYSCCTTLPLCLAISINLHGGAVLCCFIFIYCFMSKLMSSSSKTLTC